MDRHEAIKAVMEPGEWLDHYQIHARLPQDFISWPSAWRSTAQVCRREAKLGRLIRKKTTKSNRGWRWVYARP